MNIVKRDYDNYERCMGNAIRIQTGKNTFTCSENEERGKGKRKKIQPKGYSSSSDDDISKTPTTAPPRPKQKYRSSPRRSLFQSSSPTNSSPIAYSHTRLNVPVLVSPPRNFNIAPPPRKQQTSPRTLSITSESPVNTPISSYAQPKCHLPSKRTHGCTFAHGPLTQESTAKQLCSLSRSIYILTQKMKDFTEELRSRSVSEEKVQVKSKKVEDEEDEDILKQQANDLLKLFPFESIKDFNDFNVNLMKEETETKAKPAFHLIGLKSSYSRFITSVLRKVIGENLVPSFTWKGHYRSNHGIKKMSFSETSTCELLIRVVRKKFSHVPDIKQKIEKSISGWLSQTQTKLQRQNIQSSSNMTGVNQENTE